MTGSSRDTSKGKAPAKRKAPAARPVKSRKQPSKAATTSAKAAAKSRAAAKAKAAAKPPGVTAEQRKRAADLRAAKRLTSTQRAMKDALVIELHAQHLTYAQIKAIDGRSERQLRRVVKDHEAGPRVGILNARPVETIEGMLRRQSMAWRLFFQIAVDADSDSARVGAIRGMVMVDDKQRELLHSLGYFPDPEQMGLVVAAETMARISEAMIDVMSDLRAGKTTVDAAYEVFIGALKQTEGGGLLELEAPS